MLCDELVANGAPGNGCDISCMLPMIHAAQKFTLTPECAAVAEALANDYSGLVRAFPHCRLPFAQTWIEVAHAHRPEWGKAQMQAPDFQVIPKRIGYLLTATRPDLSAWTAHLFWSSTDASNGCSCPVLAMGFDMTQPFDHYTELPQDDHRPSRIIKHVAAHPGWMQAAKNVQLAMLNHTQPVLTDYPLPTPPEIPPARLDEYFEIMAELSRSDWAGEPAYLLAIIGLLNARNAVETEAVDCSKLNRMRRKRGRPLFFEHKLLKIARRQQQRVYSNGESRGDHTPMRQHFCRGHFKTRRTGIFFWHPHLRGDPTRGKIEKEYELH